MPSLQPPPKFPSSTPQAAQDASQHSCGCMLLAQQDQPHALIPNPPTLLEVELESATQACAIPRLSVWEPVSAPSGGPPDRAEQQTRCRGRLWPWVFFLAPPRFKGEVALGVCEAWGLGVSESRVGGVQVGGLVLAFRCFPQWDLQLKSLERLPSVWEECARQRWRQGRAVSLRLSLKLAPDSDSEFSSRTPPGSSPCI
eukprot:616344-Rhodomonas_salina.1